MTGDTFKTRYGTHKHSFNSEKAKNSTELSKYIWKLKDGDVNFDVKWTVKTKAFAFKRGGRHCDLCISEKTVISLADPSSTLNTRNEIISKCRHKHKHMLVRLL